MCWRYRLRPAAHPPQAHTHQPLHLFKSLKPQTVCCCPDPFLSYNSWRASGGHRSRKRPAESKTSFPVPFLSYSPWRASLPQPMRSMAGIVPDPFLSFHFASGIDPAADASRSGHRSRSIFIVQSVAGIVPAVDTFRGGHRSRSIFIVQSVAGICPAVLRASLPASPSCAGIL